MRYHQEFLGLVKNLNVTVFDFREEKKREGKEEKKEGKGEKEKPQLQKRPKKLPKEDRFVSRFAADAFCICGGVCFPRFLVDVFMDGSVIHDHMHLHDKDTVDEADEASLSLDTPK